MNGVYGTRKPAYITNNDIDIFYHFRPNRNSDSEEFIDGWKKLDSKLLANAQFNNEGAKEILPGMFNLRLPLNIFSEVGFYDVYIKPKEVFANILDVSTLYAYPNIKGIVIDFSETGLNYENGNLIGYRVEYFDGNDRQDIFRIITSNNRCEPIAQNLNDGFSKGITYGFNNSSNLVFCTLSPSSEMSFNKSINQPFIGNVQQKVAIINTKFNPVMIEVEMTDKDINSIATMLEGEQIRNLNKGLITTFTDDGGIYHQADYGNITNPETGVNHDFKLKRNNVDMSEATKLKEIKDEI